MKKTCKLLLLGTALATTMTISAAAANFTHCADSLHAMDLFSGTENGYELDRAPTRAEAAVMLVRLLGGEKDATANTYETPFTDVPTWAAPYVGWLYHNNLTAGATETTYDTEGACTAQMYATFLMRSLGYTDTGDNADFSYSNSLTFAKEKGVVDDFNCDPENFLRDDVVAMSYTALATQPKDGKNDTLLDQLVASGAVDATKAKSTQDTFKAYNEYTELSKKMADVTDMAMNMKMSMDMKLNDANLAKADMDMNVQANMDMENLDNSKLAMKGKITMNLDESLVEEGQQAQQTMDMEAYFTNGAYYVKSGDQKIKTEMSVQDMMDGMGLSEMVNTVEPISLFKSIAKNSDGSYKIEYAASSMNDMIANILTSAGMTADMGSMTFDNVAITVTPENGQPKSMAADMDCSVNVMDQKIDMAITLNYDITATGSSVKVTLPSDLDTYTDMIGGANTPA